MTGFSSSLGSNKAINHQRQSANQAKRWPDIRPETLGLEKKDSWTHLGSLVIEWEHHWRHLWSIAFLSGFLSKKKAIPRSLYEYLLLLQECLERFVLETTREGNYCISNKETHASCWVSCWGRTSIFSFLSFFLSFMHLSFHSLYWHWEWNVLRLRCWSKEELSLQFSCILLDHHVCSRILCQSIRLQFPRKYSFRTKADKKIGIISDIISRLSFKTRILKSRVFALLFQSDILLQTWNKSCITLSSVTTLGSHFKKPFVRFMQPFMHLRLQSKIMKEIRDNCIFFSTQNALSLKRWLESPTMTSRRLFQVSL